MNRFAILDSDYYKAVFSQTTRGKEQLIFCGQPFIYEKRVSLPDGEVKKLWRCNQWWNKKCRARVYTIRDIVTPLNKYHTHEDIIRRKKRIAKKKIRAPIESPPSAPVGDVVPVGIEGPVGDEVPVGEEVSHFFIIQKTDKDSTAEDDETAFTAHLL